MKPAISTDTASPRHNTDAKNVLCNKNTKWMHRSMVFINKAGWPALLVLDLNEDNRHITSHCSYNTTWNTTNYSEFVLIWFVASLLSMQFVWAVLIYFYTIVMTNNGLLNASPCHVDSIRHRMATNCSAPSKPKLDRIRANKGCNITSIDAVHMSNGDMLLYYHYQV